MRTRLAALALCAVVAVPARAGVTLTMEGKGGRTVISTEGNKARVDDDGRDGRTASIFDGDRRPELVFAGQPAAGKWRPGDHADSLADAKRQ